MVTKPTAKIEKLPPVETPTPSVIAFALPPIAPDSLKELTSSSPVASGPASRPRQTPERSIDFAKMREAANITTSNALHTFDCKSLIRRAYSQLALSIGSMATSLVLLAMNDEVWSVAFDATVVMLVVSAVATYRYGVTTRMLAEKLRPLR